MLRWPGASRTGGARAAAAPNRTVTWQGMREGIFHDNRPSSPRVITGPFIPHSAPPAGVLQGYGDDGCARARSIKLRKASARARPSLREQCDGLLACQAYHLIGSKSRVGHGSQLFQSLCRHHFGSIAKVPVDCRTPFAHSATQFCLYRENDAHCSKPLRLLARCLQPAVNSDWKRSDAQYSFDECRARKPALSAQQKADAAVGRGAEQHASSSVSRPATNNAPPRSGMLSRPSTRMR